MAVRSINLLNHIAAGFETLQGGVAVGASHQVRNPVAASGSHGKAGAGQRKARLGILFQDNQLGILEVLKLHDVGFMLIDNLDDPGLRVDDVAIRDISFPNLVVAGFPVRQVDSAVLVCDVLYRVIGSPLGGICIPQVTDGELGPGKRLAGDSVMLHDQKPFLGRIFELHFNHTVAHGSDGDNLRVRVRRLIASRRDFLSDAVGPIGDILEDELTICVRSPLTGNLGALLIGMIQVNGFQCEDGAFQQPGIGGIPLDYLNAAVVGVLEGKLHQLLVRLQVLRDGISIAAFGPFLPVLVVFFRHFQNGRNLTFMLR